MEDLSKRLQAIEARLSGLKLERFEEFKETTVQNSRRITSLELDLESLKHDAYSEDKVI